MTFETESDALVNECSEIKLVAACATFAAKNKLIHNSYTPLEKVALVSLTPKNIRYDNNVSLRVHEAEELTKNFKNNSLFKNQSKDILTELLDFLIEGYEPSKRYECDLIKQYFSTRDNPLFLFKAMIPGEENMLVHGKLTEHKAALTHRRYFVLHDPVISLHPGPKKGFPTEKGPVVIEPFNKSLFEMDFEIDDPKYIDLLCDAESRLERLSCNAGISPVTAKNEIDTVHLRDMWAYDVLHNDYFSGSTMRLHFFADPAVEEVYRNVLVLRYTNKLKPHLKELYNAAFLVSLVRRIFLNNEEPQVHAATIMSLLESNQFGSLMDKLDEIKNSYANNTDRALLWQKYQRELEKKLSA